MSKRVIVLPLLLGLIAALLPTLRAEGQGGPTTPPPGFCEGTVPWVYNPGDQLPEQDPCGVPGTWIVEVGLVQTNHPNYQSAKLEMETRGATLGGSFWLQPNLGSKVYIPFLTHELFNFPPEGFCEGTVPWVYNPGDQLPEQDPCGVPGTWIVEVGLVQTNHPNYQSAKLEMETRGATLGGSFWLQNWLSR